MVVMLRLQEALSLKQGQRLVVGPSGAPRDDPVMLLLLLQGQLPLRPPQSTQSIETVLQKSGVSVALVSTDGSQALGELHWVLGLKRQDLQEHRMAQKRPSSGSSKISYSLQCCQIQGLCLTFQVDTL